MIGRDIEKPLAGHETLVTLTIDTEPDSQWTDHRVKTIENIRYLDRFERFCLEHAVRPTFLVTYGVAKHGWAMDMLNKIVECTDGEIGTHLHSWDNPPFAPSGIDSEYPIFAHDLPLELFQKKIEALTDMIRSRSGSPSSYRAGRFGFCAEHIKTLENFGYKVDSSVTSLVNRSNKIGLPLELGGKGGRNYSTAPYQPYYLSYHDENISGESDLLELPVTTDFTRLLPTSVMKCYPSFPTLLKKVLRKSSIMRPISASFPTQDRMKDVMNMQRVAIERGHHCITNLLHSSQLMPGGGLHSEDEQAVDRHYNQLELVIEMFKKSSKAQFVTLQDAGKILSKNLRAS